MQWSPDVARVLEFLTSCPTCDRKLQIEWADGKYSVHCPDRFHGRFVLSSVDGKYDIKYELKPQALA